MSRILAGAIAVLACACVVVFVVRRSGERAGPQLNSTELSKQQFTDLFADMARREIPNADVSVTSELTIAVKTPQMNSTVSLDNAWAEYRNNPDGRQQVFQRYIDIARETLAKGPSTDKMRIFPVVRATSYIENAKKQAGGKWDPITQPLASDLAVLYVEDGGKGMRFLQQSDLNELHLKVSELRSQAMANLSALAAKATWNDFHGAHLLHIDGNYESSMLALNDFWKTTTPKVDGDLVVIVPLRDMVLATGSNSHETVAMLRTLAQRAVAEGDHPISDALYTRQNDAWVKQ